MKDQGVRIDALEEPVHSSQHTLFNWLSYRGPLIIGKNNHILSLITEMFSMKVAIFLTLLIESLS
jgi:hypothetical protein